MYYHYFRCGAKFMGLPSESSLPTLTYLENQWVDWDITERCSDIPLRAKCHLGNLSPAGLKRKLSDCFHSIPLSLRELGVAIDEGWKWEALNTARSSFVVGRVDPIKATDFAAT